jgi:hypothetical protein
MSSDAPKLIIDSDWKSQAQAEKQRLEQQAASKKPAAGAMGGAMAGAMAGAAAGAEGEEGPVELSILHLVEMLSMQALSYMGALPDPRTGQAMISLEYAKLHIDLLGILEEKTKGNLNEEEAKAVQGTVSELRMHFVTVQQAVAKAVAEGRIKPQQAGVGGMGGGMGAGPKGPTLVGG